MRLLRRWAGRLPGSDPYAPGNNPYQYDPHYRDGDGGTGGGYPGDRAPPPDLTDEAAFIGLGPRDGDEQVRRPRYPNARWGSTTFLERGQSIAPIITALFDDPLPIGFQLRFSADGVNYSAVMPVGCGVDVKLTKSFDPKAGKASEVFGIDPGQTQPMCMVIARSLTLTMKCAETALTGVWVQAVACPLTALDCDVVIPPPPTTPAALTTRTIARYPAVASPAYNIGANAKRGYLLIVNQSAANLYVALGSGVDTTPGSEFATIILPPGAFSGYNVDNWTGTLSFQFDADDDAGFALLTEGLYP